MKIVLTLLLFILISTTSFPQSFLWAKSGGGSSGDYGNSIATDANGNVFVTGWFQNMMTLGSYTLISSGFYDIFVAKYDPNGNVVWAVKAGGGQTDIGYGISTDAAGAVYVAGAFAGPCAFGSTLVNSNGSAADAYVAKLSPSGTWLWVRTGGSSVDDQAQCIDVSGSTVAISGYFKSTATFSTGSVTSNGNSDIFVAKYDTAGNFQWVRGGGGTSYEIAYGTAIDPSGNIYSNGYFRSTATFGSNVLTSTGGDDAVLLQYSPTGTCNWAKKGGGAGDDKGLGVTADASGIYVTGWFLGNASFDAQNISSAGNNDVYVAKYNTAGTAQWASRAGGIYSDGGYGIAVEPNGELWVTGSFDTTAMIGPVQVNSYGGTDMFVGRLDANTGVFDIAISGGAQAATIFQKDISYGVAVAPNGVVYAAGVFQNTATWIPYFTQSNGIQDFFVVAIDQTTGIANPPQKVALLFPNPASGEFHILPADGQTSPERIRILNMQGQCLLSIPVEQHIPGSQIDIMIPRLAPGMYIVEVSGKTIDRFHLIMQ